MKIIYVNARFLTQKITGVQRYAIEIFLELVKKNDNIVFLCPPGIIHKDLAKIFNPKVIGVNRGTLWEQMDLPLFLWLNKSPLLVSLGNVAPMLYKNVILCHHDISYIRYPESISKKAGLWYKTISPFIIKRCRALITVSEFSKKDISKYYNLTTRNVEVVYNSSSHTCRTEKKESKKNHSEEKKEKYFLMVSSINSHKNIDFVLQSFADPRLKSYKLKIVGGGESFFRSNGYLNYENSNIEFLGRVSDEVLFQLYSNARCFIFPSFYEGFGIPPLEAQSLGCPVISSCVTSMPEVLGNSAMFFSPYNKEEFCEKILQLDTDEYLINKFVRLGYENVKRFSWEKSAQKLNDIISHLLDEKK